MLGSCITQHNKSHFMLTIVNYLFLLDVLNGNKLKNKPQTQNEKSKRQRGWVV